MLESFANRLRPEARCRWRRERVARPTRLGPSEIMSGRGSPSTTRPVTRCPVSRATSRVLAPIRLVTTKHSSSVLAVRGAAVGIQRWLGAADRPGGPAAGEGPFRPRIVTSVQRRRLHRSRSQRRFALKASKPTPSASVAYGCSPRSFRIGHLYRTNVVDRQPVLEEDRLGESDRSYWITRDLGSMSRAGPMESIIA